MLYELIVVARPGNLMEVKDIARSCGIQILRSGGIIRGITNWGPFRLASPTTKHQARYDSGHHFVMRFDANIATQLNVRRTLGLDPRMIRFSVVKLGSKLDEVKDIPGTEKWNDRKEKDHLRNLVEVGFWGRRLGFRVDLI